MAMTSIYILNLITDIAKEHINEDLGATMSESSRGAAKVGAATLVSSLVLGPAGLIVGSIGGGIWAYATTSNFKPLTSIISEMTEDERERMVTVAKDVAKERGLELALANMVTSSPEARGFLMEVMKRVGLVIKSSSE